MHIPDGFLTLNLALTMWALSIAVLGYSIKKVRENGVNTAMLGVVSAGIFAAQMLNWPIPGGTSAHFVGGALAGILLGPYAGSIAMASVLIIQALIYGDGGLIALGANLWNMAVVNVFVGYYLYRLLSNTNRNLAAFVAGWLGITLAAAFAGIELGLSSDFKYNIFITTSAMGLWHGVLGIIEGIITAGIVSYVHSSRSDLGTETKVSKKALTVIALMILVSPVFAYLAELVNYSEPLENVAHQLGIEENQEYSGILPDYTVPGLNDYLGTLISGLVGVGIFISLAMMRRHASAD
ncbi:energy-coupling factor ABC transporter permease [Geoglobus acetivorans]|uniref:Energy-coupling factor ABC transporter permease n=1 Tax=Geoglobus acetivorans TaxID=565033 RepID=A0ABZ3H2H5_GEOAI|nr:energy-coupling factor ABC transporter permease [Geoglobus acetivorans]